MSSETLSNKGYAEEAPDLLVRYEALSFERVHGVTRHLFPTTSSAILDIGAGTGRDAAYLAAAGHRVTAVEPTRELREPAASLHPSKAITWVDDSLPGLETVRADGAVFDFILIWAVWMHLAPAARDRAMPVVTSLLKPGGRLLMSLRHGPVPAGRQMFEVPAQETVRQAGREGLRTILREHTGSIEEANAKAGVTWSLLAFEKGA